MLWERKSTGKCFHSFLEFSQTPTCVSITKKKCTKRTFSISLGKHCEKQHLIDYQNVNSLYLRHYFLNGATLRSRSFTTCFLLGF